MPERKLSVTDVLQGITAAVGALSALFIGLSTLSKSLDALPLLPASPLLRWVIAIAFAALATIIGRRLLPGRPAKLIRSDIFFVRPDRAEHLKGRGEDIERLFSLCRQQAEVFLVGESGAGKSALIQSGLIPRLADSGLLPVYLNSWGRDWEEGPRSGIQEALRGLHVATLTEAAEEARKQEKRLLVIFDQFDDYQSAHQSRFRSAAQTVLSVSELANANFFWREVQSLLVNGTIHALFVTRADTTAGLESVRFVTPEVYPLDRLPASAATELLDSLTKAGDDSQPPIDSAEHGWPALRDRLVRDLSEEGSVLPVRMSLALAGLRTLPYLTVREYERGGGLEGLEAAYVEWRVQNGARAAGIQNSEALRILTAMVDREARKTRPCTMAELCAAVPALRPEAVKAIVSEWEKKELLRRRPAIDTGSDTWSLDHDYLSGGVLAAETRASRAAVLLRDSEQDHRASGRNLWRRWRTLLTPRQQIGLALDRMRGRFRYAEKRSFALLSMIRFLPQIVILAGLFVVTNKQIDDVYSRKATAYLDAIGVVEGDVTEDEVKTFWSIAQSPAVLRRHFLIDAFHSPGNTAQLARRLPAALAAGVGLDRSLQQEVLADVRRYALDPKTDAAIRQTAIDTAIELGEFDFDLVMVWADSADAEEPAPEAWTRLERTITPAQADRLFEKITANGLDDHVAWLPGKISNDAIAATIARFDNEANPDAALKIIGRISSAALTAEQKGHVAARLRSVALNPESDDRTVISALSLLKSLGVPGLSDDEARTIYGRDQFTTSGTFGELLTFLPPPAEVAIALLQPRASPHSVIPAQTAVKLVTSIRPADYPVIAQPLRAWAGGVSFQQLSEALLALPAGSPAYDVVADIAGKQSKSWSYAQITGAAASRSFGRGRQKIAPLIAELLRSRLERQCEEEPTLEGRLKIAKVARAFGGDSQRMQTLFVEPTIAALTNQQGDIASRQNSLVSSCRLAWKAFSPAQRQVAETWLVQQALSGATTLDLSFAWSDLSSEHQKQISAAFLKTALEKPDPALFTTLIKLGGVPEPYSDEVVKQMSKALSVGDEDDASLFYSKTLAATLVEVKTSLPPGFTNTIFRRLVTGENSAGALAILRRYPSQAKVFNRIAEELLDSTSDDGVAATAATVLLASDGSPETVVEIAKKPTCIDQCFATVLEHAENLAGKGKFQGDRWQFVAWAEKKGLDVTSAPRRLAVTAPQPKPLLARLFK